MSDNAAIIASCGFNADQPNGVLLAQIAEEGRAILSQGREAARNLARARLLIRDLQQRLAEPYVFKVFPQYTIAYGLLYTFRQTWEPDAFQVGDLIATIPLAPRESRKIQKRVVVRETRQTKELRKSIKNLVSDNTSTSTLTSEVAKRAEAKNTTNVTAEGSYGNGQIYQVKATGSLNRDAKKLSEETKKSIRENALKALQEIREERQVEIDTTSDTTLETTTSGEISNPNDEIAVTYLYYTLGRQYYVSEALYKITPVVFVANPFPNPSDIDADWLIEHEWILRHVILDEAFLPSLDLLKKSKDGQRIGLKALEASLAAAYRAMAETRDFIGGQETLRDNAARRLDSAVQRLANVQGGEDSEGVVEKLHEWLFGSPAGESTDATATQKEAAESVFTRIEESIAAARNRLSQLQGAVEGAAREYVDAIQHYMDSLQQVLALRLHVKQNITYYMQAIWKRDFADQRYFRLFDKAVPFIPIDPAAVRFTLDSAGALTIQLPPAGNSVNRRLDEIADIDSLLGFKGNFMLFPLKEACHITTEMLAAFLDADAEVVDPDASSAGSSLTDLLRTRTLLDTDRQTIEAVDPNDPRVAQHRNEVAMIDMVIASVGLDSKLKEPRSLVLVPTDMLYIEALTGANPVMENYKLTHRRLDAELVREKVKAEAINNLRMTALLSSGNFVDPDIDKQIFIKSDVPIAGTFSATAASTRDSTSGGGQ
jgi:hypothetical protein